MDNTTTGLEGEEAVKQYLINKAHKVLHQNYICSPFGEIDLVTTKEGVIYFVEVKTRKNASFMDLTHTVNQRKYEAMKRASEIYISKEKIPRDKYRLLITLATLNIETGEIEFFEDLNLNESL